MTDLSSEVTIVREILQPPFAVVMGSDEIVRVYTSDSAWITIKEAKNLVKALKEITNSIPHLILKIPGRHATNDKEARSYLASNAAMKYSISEAIVASNMGHRIMGNLLINTDGPRKPVKVFENETEAIEWLKKQRTRLP